MRSNGSRQYLIDLVIDHCSAFSDQIQPLKSRQYASEFPLGLINALEALNDEIKLKLNLLRSDPDFLLLSDEVAHRTINRYLQLYNYLCNSASFVDRSDIPHTIVELVQPTNRLMKLHTDVEEFELLLYPFPILNYVFLNLGRGLSDIKRELGISNIKVKFPKQLIAIGFPGLESAQILSHCVIAHELGHCLYTQHNLNRKLLPLVRLSKSKVKRMLPPAPYSMDDISRITHEISLIHENWVKELTCDAIGYLLFGPAFLFAAIDLFPIVHPSFDYAESTHPTTRMRLLLLYKMFSKEEEFNVIIDSTVRDHLNKWREITKRQKPKFSNLVTQLAGQAILKIYDNIIDAATVCVGKSRIYSASSHAGEIQKLADRAKYFILPNEYIERGKAKVVSMQSIFNAGWLIYLGELNILQTRFKFDLWESKRKFNEIIARAIELNELQKRWREVR